MNNRHNGYKWALDAACDYFGFDITERRRLKEFTEPRQMFFGYLYEYTTLTKRVMGLLCGGRDHSTVINALSRHSDIQSMEELKFAKEYLRKYSDFVTYMSKRKAEHELGGELASFEKEILNIAIILKEKGVEKDDLIQKVYGNLPYDYSKQRIRIIDQVWASLENKPIEAFCTSDDVNIPTSVESV